MLRYFVYVIPKPILNQTKGFKREAVQRILMREYSRNSRNLFESFKMGFGIIQGILLLLMSISSANANFLKENSKFIQIIGNTSIMVVAPASTTNDELLQTLRSITKPKFHVPLQCFNNRATSFHAHTDQVRFECFRDALFSDHSNILWALRGGYGAAKLIPYLQTLPKPKNKKILIGCSDITALHLFLSQEWGWHTIHGSNVRELIEDKEQRDNFIKLAAIITGRKQQIKIRDLKPLNHIATQCKNVNGLITGGNLTIVQTSIGSSWQMQSQGKILFFEDVSVAPYQVDRMLLHLQQAGLLDKAKAIVFGTFGKDDQNILPVLRDLAEKLPLPVFKSNRFGHDGVNDPIVYNASSEITRSHNAGLFELVMQLK